jgi:hypothetical protein
MKESRCIICGNRREGLEVVDDYMIGLIRWYKHKTHTEKRYRLVVCRDCFEKYRKARRGYQRRQVELLILGFAFAAIFVMSRPLLGVVVGSAMILALYALSQLTWMPAVRMPETGKAKEK